MKVLAPALVKVPRPFQGWLKVMKELAQLSG